jgi:hypothetical protein
LPPINQRHADERAQPDFGEASGALVAGSVHDLQRLQMRRHPALDALMRLKTAWPRGASGIAETGPDDQLAALPI